MKWYDPFKWFLNLFDDTPAKSNVIFKDGHANGMNTKQAKKKAMKGWKVRWVEWPAGHYMFYDPHNAWLKYDDTWDHWWYHNGSTNEPLQRNLMRHVGQGWTTCGRV